MSKKNTGRITSTCEFVVTTDCAYHSPQHSPTHLVLVISFVNDRTSTG